MTAQKPSAFRRIILGWLDGRDRVEIFTDTAGAATDASAAYWSRSRANFLSTVPRVISDPAAPVIDTFHLIMQRFTLLRVEVRAGRDVPRSRVDSLSARLRKSTVVIDSAGAFARQISIRLVPQGH